MRARRGSGESYLWRIRASAVLAVWWMWGEGGAACWDAWMKGNQITSANHWRHVCQELFTDGRNGWKQDTSEALFNDTQVADVTAAAGREGGLFILLWSVTLLWQAVCEDKYRITDLIQKKCQKQYVPLQNFRWRSSFIGTSDQLAMDVLKLWFWIWWFKSYTGHQVTT